MGEQISELADHLKDSDAAVRYSAVQRLGRMGPAAAPAIPALREMLNDPDGDVSLAAATALTLIQSTEAGNDAAAKEEAAATQRRRKLTEPNMGGFWYW